MRQNGTPGRPFRLSMISKPSVIRPLMCTLAIVMATSCSLGTVAGQEPFLRQYCVDCHSSDDPNGDREFTTLDLTDSKIDNQLLLQEIVDQITLGAMPPKDSDQPSNEDRLQAIRQLTNVLAKMRAETTSTGGKTVLRRLSRREYLNTVGDLLGLDMTMFDPSREFPADNLSEGFDNVGDQLVTSGFLTEKYLDAADTCVEKAFAALNYPEPQMWKFDDNFNQQPELGIAHRKAFNYRYMVLYDHPLNDKPEGAFGPLNNFKQGVPADGMYEIRVKAQALNRDTPYSTTKAVFIDTSEPFRMGIRPGDARIGELYKTQPIQPLLDEAVIADDELKWYTYRVPLDRGFSPRLTFENGQHDVRGASSRVFRHHKDLFPKNVRNSNGIVARRNAAVAVGYYPQIRIHEVKIHGPLADSPQKNIHKHLFAGDEFNPNHARDDIRTFASRAFRRPATDLEVDQLYSLYAQRVGTGHQPIEAYKDALKAILCSPGFLYFSSPDDATTDRLSQHALAERLAYFLTSSMPDDRLRGLADAGTLDNADALRSEVKRLLSDPASDRFVADFLDSWLNLRSLGSMPPDQQAFREYYSSHLEPEMKEETRLFIRDLIDRNASILELLTADYSFVNRDLAKLYGVADQVPVDEAERFHRVVFEDARRGGLLGQASVLTVTANGIETSPVVRGVWLLEKVLGTPSPPPPDAVPPIDPDVRGATSIRDRLKKHSTLAACSECHRKFDPLGFALESFDPIGRARTFYDRQRRIPVDTSGVLPSGEEFTGLAELKQLLVKQKEFFIRTVTSRLLTHALGRRIEATDRAAIDKIVDQVRDEEYPTQDLILAIVTSDLFHQH